MSRTLLISLEDIQQMRGISANVDSFKSLEPYILDAQQFDIKPLLGTQLWLDLLDEFEASPSLSSIEYNNLFNGCEYTFNNRRYEHFGIKAVLINYAYGRFSLYSGVQSTKTGFVVKNDSSGNSTPASEDKVSRIANGSKSVAIGYQNEVVDYLNHNYTLFPNWLYRGEKKSTQVRITAVGGNSKRMRCRRCGMYECNCNRRCFLD